MTVEELKSMLAHYNDNDIILFKDGQYRYEVRTITMEYLHDDLEDQNETKLPESIKQPYLVIS